jgi:hypothetical protein
MLTSGLMRVSATGGEAVAVMAAAPATLRRSPHFLPDGRRLLFFQRDVSAATTGIYLGTLDGSAPRRLTPADGAGVYLPSVPGRADPTSLAVRATSEWLPWATPAPGWRGECPVYGDDRSGSTTRRLACKPTYRTGSAPRNSSHSPRGVTIGSGARLPSF